MKNQQNICLNCENKLDPEDKYCPECGQKATFHNLSIKFLFQSFLDALLYFDVKLFQSFRDIWIPNKIIRDYASGKRRNYVHPFRLLFVLLLIFFGLTAISLRNLELDSNLSMEERFTRYKIYEKFHNYADTLSDPDQKAYLDSLNNILFEDQKNYAQDTFVKDDILGVDFVEKGITTKDIYELPKDSLFRKYNINSWREKLVITQLKRISLDADLAVRFVITNMLWAFILITVLMALVLQLLYIRHDVYYVENFVHIVTFHTQLLILWTLLMIIKLFAGLSAQYFFLASLIPVALLFYNLKTYYNQSFLKTALKYIVLHAMYLIILGMVVTIIAFISLLFF